MSARCALETASPLLVVSGRGRLRADRPYLILLNIALQIIIIKAINNNNNCTNTIKIDSFLNKRPVLKFKASRLN